MKVRSGARHNARTRRRKATKPKRRKAAQSASPSAASQDEIARLTRELNEALEQQTATSDVLRIISSSPGDLRPVFNAILENATRICEAKLGAMAICDNGGFRLVASHGTPPAYMQFREREPILHPSPEHPLGRIAATKQVVHISDVSAAPEQARGRLADLAGARTLLAVPMLKENDLVGGIAIFRQEVRPFTSKQIELVQNFAAQAVIAIENARLLNELRQRTTDLTETLKQQTATSEVLRVISSSAGDLDPVFNIVLTNATQICEAIYGGLFLVEGEAFRTVALHNVPPAFAEERRREPLIRARPGTIFGRVAETGEPVQIADVNSELGSLSDPRAMIRLAGVRTLLIVPMVKDEELVGAVGIFRQEVRPFTDKQVELLKNFAAQAVIAIENARLLNELRERTGDLEESLEYQTATSDVLKVISGSVFDLQKILEFVAETAARLCAAKQVGIFLLENDVYRFTIGFGLTTAYREIEERAAIKPGPETVVGRVALQGETVHILDVLSDPDYGPKDDVRAANVHTVLAVPLTRESNVVGVIVLARETVSSFSSEQIELVRTFADQAVIAIENARLLNELRERTEQVEAQSQQLVRLNQQLERRVADQVGEIERMGRLRRFLPPQVADLIVTSGTEKQLESHRREITALFCDLRGFTGFSESADPEDVMALLRDYHAAIGEIIIKYSGTLERYAGDGVMVVFNDPVPVENPALKAVLMALEMRTSIGALTDRWRRLGHDIGFGIGIAHGFATLGTIGFEGRFDYAAIGTVSNVASRLCDEAKPGQILISPRVFMAVEDAVTVEPVGEFALKGIRRPLAAYNVLASGILKPDQEHTGPG
jgi:GAF domain-containing protein